MALLDSMFLFEIVIKDFKSYIDCNQFDILGRFAEIFKVCLKNLTDIPYTKKLRMLKCKQKYTVRNYKDTVNKPARKIEALAGQSILIINKTSVLISLMKKYGLEIFITKENNPDQALGSTIVPWSNTFINYLSNTKNTEFPPAYAEEVYNVYNELTSIRIATVYMSIKLTHLKDTLLSHVKSISNHNLTTRALSTIKESKTKNVKNHFGCIINNSDITKRSKIDVVSTKSYLSSIDCKQKNYLDLYIYGDLSSYFGNKVYHVGYFTVEKDISDQSSSRIASDERSLEKSTKGRKKLKICDSECFNKKTPGYLDNVCLLNLPNQADDLVSITKCKEVKCDFKKHRELPPPSDNRIILDLSNLKTDCCASTVVTEKIEEVEGGITTKMKIGQDPCYCTCECRFGFTKKTTYCTVCGGYEIAGEDLARKTAQELPTPCPIFHKLVDKNKLKTWSTSGSESKRRGDGQKSMKTSSGQKATVPDKRIAVNEKKNIESGKKKKRDDRFKFNYGYKAPQIGHSKCAMPCSGTLENVPKSMGWLWTAEDVPGMKFRPMWKPGATNKHVVRLLRIARNPDEAISKKKRRDTGKKKRPLKRPLLVVHKKDGEYTVTMETMKAYSKPRALNQHPYEDKPVVSYTIGRTDEENRDRLKKKERRHRRLERAQREFIQSAFRNMCHEICLKTYQQALGILPNAEDPICSCYSALPASKITNMDVSCSCSEDKSSIGSDSESDEWIVEFTPPNAVFDPTHKGKKVFKTDNGSQYTYLDYRVKLVDSFGKPVPRFFKGPDGKQECSDLGGFWNPNHNWLEINVDGYVAPDGRWAPNSFIGPSGENVDAEIGKFQTTTGKWLVVGVDGFIDSQGKWKYYPKPANSIKNRHRGATEAKRASKGDKKLDKVPYKSEASWSCLGDVSPKQLSKLGIIGHGEDRKLLISTLQEKLAHGEDVKIPQPSRVFHLPISKQQKKERKGGADIKLLHSFQERYKFRHPVPSAKGIVAVDDHGDKIYFKLKDYHNKRPEQRLITLSDRGISLSSFHVPCFSSFINTEIMKQQQRERIFALCTKTTATQV